MTNLFARNKSVLAAGLATLVLATAGCGKDKEAAPAAPEATTEVQLEEMVDKVTYIVGFNMATQAKSNGLEFQKDVMAVAIQDVLDGKEPRIAQEEQQKIMMAFQEEQQSKREAERSKLAEANMAKAKAYLEENAKKEGVTVTESGLQYEVLESGEEGAPMPTAEDKVKVHYHGTLVDGEVFDSSVDRGQPVTFPVKGVIQGWIEGLQLMKVGDKFKLTIPPELAYGQNGTAGKIGPNAALVFDVELLEINPGPEEAAAEGEAEAEPEASTEE